MIVENPTKHELHTAVYAARVGLRVTKLQGLLCQASCILDVAVCGDRSQVSVV